MPILSDILSEPIYIAIGIMLLIFFFITIALKNSKMPYKAQDALLTKAELHFYRALVQVVPSHLQIMMKVRMADIITCTDNQWKSGWGPKISAKHIDFVLIDPKTTQIKLAIELDDSTHRTNQNRIERDSFVNKAFEVAGVELFRIDVVRNYNIERLKEDILRLLPQ